MKTWVILLRGINVGGRGILPMKELTTLLEGYSYKDVKTYIQSGNIVVRGNRVNATDIGDLIFGHFGFRPKVMVLTASELTRVAGQNPFPRDGGKAVHMYFCARKPKPDLGKINRLKAESEAFLIKGKVLYLHAPDGLARSKLAAGIEGCLGVRATGRNLNTVNKLLEMTVET